MRGLLGVVLLAGLAATSAARATAGFAETAWPYAVGPGRWIEWNHGDVCPQGAPGKNCVIERERGERRRQETRPDERAIAPVLLLPTALAMVPPLAVVAGVRRFLARRRPLRPRDALLPSALVLAGALGLPHALATLFPASFATQRADALWLGVNGLIVLSPWLAWRSWRRLRPPRGAPRARGLVRAGHCGLLLVAAALAPSVLFGPPHLMAIVFPPLLLPHVLLTLALSWGLARRIDRSSARRANALR